MDSQEKEKYCTSRWLTYSLSSIVLIALTIVSGCDQSDYIGYGDAACDPGIEVIKPVTDETGIVSFDSNINQWIVLVSIEGTYDSQDAGIVCNELSAEFQQAGKRVVFSGSYQPYLEEDRSPLGGWTYYYLSITTINGI